MRALPILFVALLLACGDDGGSAADASSPAFDAGVDATPPIDAAVAPLLRNPVDLEDGPLGREALRLLGSSVVGGTKNCNACHGLTRQTLRHWRALSDQSLGGCLTDLSISTPEVAREMIDCLRMEPGVAASPFLAGKLGIYSAAAHLDWFEFLFWRASDDGADAGWQTEFDAFVGWIGMPQDEHPPFTQAELDVVAEWFARGVPELDTILPNDPRPSECTAGVSADMTSHVADMALTGWRAVNAENMILMHGCGPADAPIDCLASYPLASSVAASAAWDVEPGTALRILRENGYRSAFWTRSSADGRFVAHGASGGGSAIVDLLENRVIPTSAAFDPGFFPDNSAFVFQGGQASICLQSLLTSSPMFINYSEPECNSTTLIGLYQHVATALGGGDHWSVDGQFVTDHGGINPETEDPLANFDSDSTAFFVPLVYDGSDFVPGRVEESGTPYEGDTVISPSARLLISRLAGSGDEQLGFVIRKLIATPEAGGYSVEIPEVARYCINGGKPDFSFDERWLVLHHYIGDEDAVELGFTGPADPAFQAYRSQGAANIYLVDLLTGAETRITHMSPGQYALYPHFRSDGWIYFIVRTLGQTDETIVASDAALVLEAGE